LTTVLTTVSHCGIAKHRPMVCSSVTLYIVLAPGGSCREKVYHSPGETETYKAQQAVSRFPADCSPSAIGLRTTTTRESKRATSSSDMTRCNPLPDRRLGAALSDQHSQPVFNTGCLLAPPDKTGPRQGG